MLLAAPVVLVLWALPASAHASLDATTPAQGSQLSVAPASVSLLFDQQVGVNAGSLRVLDPGGRDVDAGPPAHPAGNDRAVRVGLKPALGRGSYTVSWRVVSADGHPVSGTFAFGVGVPAGTVQQQVSVDPLAMVDGAMKMRPKVGGFVVPAHGNHELKPGGDHLMVMGLTAPIKAGDTVTAVLTLNDGSTVTINAIGKEYAGANESYQATGGAGMSMPAPGGPSMAASASMSK